MNWWGISTLRMLGLAWDIKLSKLGLHPQQPQPASAPMMIPPQVVEADAAAVSGD